MGQAPTGTVSSGKTACNINETDFLPYFCWEWSSTYDHPLFVWYWPSNHNLWIIRRGVRRTKQSHSQPILIRTTMTRHIFSFDFHDLVS
jgi:hypothetical protein